MIKVQRATDRGVTDLGWLDSKHTFSFGHGQTADRAPYPEGFGVLRVINDDLVMPSKGFGKHPHRDMEIISYIAGGSIAHEDSMGTVQTLGVGGVQRMSAGTGVFHSEFNPSDSETMHLFQIWIHPREEGLPPSYEESVVAREDKLNRLRPLVSSDRDPIEGTLKMGQDAAMFAGVLEAGNEVSHDLQDGRSAWVHIVRGRARVNGESVSDGDGVALIGENAVTINANEEAEVLVFDLPAV